MENTKNDRIYVRLNADIKEDFEKVAESQGLTTSAMLHSFIVKTIYETKLERPDLFDERRNEMGVTKRRASLSEKLIARKVKDESRNNNTFTTSDGETIPLVEETANKE